MTNERDRNSEVEALKAKNEALEKLVSQPALDKFMLESSLVVAEKHLGYSIKKSPALSHQPSDKKPKRDVAFSKFVAGQASAVKRTVGIVNEKAFNETKRKAS